MKVYEWVIHCETTLELAALMEIKVTLDIGPMCRKET